MIQSQPNNKADSSTTGNYHSNPETFFSISYDFIATECKLPYDLYVNSSKIDSKERFVKIFNANSFISSFDITLFKKKYLQVYILETQRGLYLKTLCALQGRSDQEKMVVLKDTAILHLQRLFDHQRSVSSEFLVENITGCKDVVETIINVISTYDIDKLKELIGNLSFHDFYTYDHSINVAMYCILLYKTINPQASKEEVINVGMGGLLHDLGKIKIPTHILNNTSKKLSNEEFAIIKKHPEYGSSLIQEAKFNYDTGINPFIINRVILEHHENYDGTGYPKKLKGEDIHLFSKICAVADFFDAITTKRAYQDPIPISEALSLMAKYQGKKLDPKVFKAFVSQTKEFLHAKESDLEVNDQFDPCKPNSKDCFNKCQHNHSGESFGDIYLLGSPDEYSAWLLKNKRIKFFK